jgi:hypothetical protein
MEETGPAPSDTPPVDPFLVMMENSRLSGGGVDSQSGGTPISNILMDLYESGHMSQLADGAKLRELPMPRPIKDGIKLKHALDLVECLWKPGERDIVSIGDNRINCLQILKEMDERVIQALSFLKGKDKVAGQTRPNHPGIGNAVTNAQKAGMYQGQRVIDQLTYWKPDWMGHFEFETKNMIKVFPQILLDSPHTGSVLRPNVGEGLADYLARCFPKPGANNRINKRRKA